MSDARGGGTERSTTCCQDDVTGDSIFGPTAGQSAHGRSFSAPRGPPSPRQGRGGGFGGEQRRVTPRQTCPRPDGFGRNLRSKTRWFTGFCNSHQVSHFATFFIDARAEISVAESRSLYSYRSRSDHRGKVTVSGASMAGTVSLSFLDAFRAGVRFVPGARGGATRTRRGGSGAHSHPSPPSGVVTCSRVSLLGRSRQ